MSDRRGSLGLRTRFMLITGCGLLAVVLCVILLAAWYETDAVEAKLRAASENELLSLNALVSSAMEQRGRDKDDVAITVFNRWFERRNTDYPGKLWSVWSPQMSAFMAETGSPLTKPPRDRFDEEALSTGRPASGFVGDTYRLSIPVILGVSAGTDQGACFDCHGATMKLSRGQVLSVFSSSLSTTAEFAALHRLLTRMAGAAVVGMLLLLATIWAIFGNVISRRLTAMTSVMSRLAAGERTVEVPAQPRADEIAAMAGAVSVFRHHMIENARLAAEQETLRRQADQDQSAALHGMADKIEAETNAALTRIGQRTGAIAAASDGMSASAARTGSAAESAAAAAVQAVANARGVAGTADQLAGSIQEISSQVNQSTSIVSRAVAAGGQARATIEALNDKVARIGVVAEMIREIAAKTNLLALNATIEAARAGEAGKGFAVVASEVKQLATQTARSTEEITRHIAEVRTATGESVTAVEGIEATITEVDSIAASIAAAMEEQGAATAEIARNVAQSADAAHDITDRVTEVSGEANTTGQRAAEVHTDASGLNELIGELRAAVVRVIRDSTREVDQRLKPRQAAE